MPLVESYQLAESNFYSIQEAAAICERDCDSEAGWNEEVHSRILNIVLRGWSKITYKNETLARMAGGGTSKIIDYAIIFVPDR